MALAERAEQRVERRHEAEGVQHRGAEELREGAHGGERARHEPPGLGGAAPERLRVLGRLPLDQPEVGVHRGQRLPELVVELARQALALLLLDRHEAGRELAQLALPLGEARAQERQKMRAADGGRGAHQEHDRRHREVRALDVVRGDLHPEEEEREREGDREDERSRRAPAEEDAVPHQRAGEDAGREPGIAGPDVDVHVQVDGMADDQQEGEAIRVPLAARREARDEDEAGEDRVPAVEEEERKGGLGRHAAALDGEKDDAAREREEGRDAQP